MELTSGRSGTLIGFGVALSVLAILIIIVGIDDLLTSLSRADRSIVMIMVGVAVAWQLAWGLALRTVLSVLNVRIGVFQAFQTYLAATFINNITPFGQAGGEPMMALIISSSSDTDYETGLAAISSVDALNFIPSIGFALLGLSYFASQFTLGRELRFVAGFIVGLALLLPILAYIGWQHYRQIQVIALNAVTPIVRGLGRIIPRKSPPTREALRARVTSFFQSITQVATNRRQLVVAMSFSALGWLGLILSLWLAFFALGHELTFSVVLIAIPAGAIAGAAPLPGGLGGVESVLGALLIPITGISPPVVGAAIILHRSTTYWLPLVIGAFTAGSLGIDDRR